MTAFEVLLLPEVRRAQFIQVSGDNVFVYVPRLGKVWIQRLGKRPFAVYDGYVPGVSLTLEEQRWISNSWSEATR